MRRGCSGQQTTLGPGPAQQPPKSLISPSLKAASLTLKHQRRFQLKQKLDSNKHSCLGTNWSLQAQLRGIRTALLAGAATLMVPGPRKSASPPGCHLQEMKSHAHKRRLMFAAAPRPWTGTLDEITVHLPTGRATYSTRAAHGHGSNRCLPKLWAPCQAAERCLLGRPGLTRVPRNLVGRWKCHVHQRVVVVTKVYTSS